MAERGDEGMARVRELTGGGPRVSSIAMTPSALSRMCFSVMARALRALWARNAAIRLFLDRLQLRDQG